MKATLYLFSALATATALYAAIAAAEPTKPSPAATDGAMVQAQPDELAWIFRRWRHRPEPTPTPTPDPQPEPNPQPTPTPTPTGRHVLAIWSALDAGPDLQAIAHSKDLAARLRAASIGWTFIDPAMAAAGTAQPPWVKAWLDWMNKRALTPPLIIWTKDGQVTETNAIGNDARPADLNPIFDRQIPPARGPLIINGIPRACGLKPRTLKAGAVCPAGPCIPQISAKLQPLKPADYPDCDYSSRIVRVRNQGNTGTCASQATIAAAEDARLVQFGDANEKQLSVASLATTVNGWDGAQLSDCMSGLMQYGVLLESEQPWPNGTRPANWKQRAANHRALIIYDAPDTDPVGYLAAALKRGWLCVIGINVGSGFDLMGQKFIRYQTGTGRGGHALLACGKRKIDGTNCTLVLNSWSKDWGANGFAWIEDTFINRSPFGDLWTLVGMNASPDDQAPSPPPQAPTNASPPTKKPTKPPQQPCPTGSCPWCKPTAAN